MKNTTMREFNIGIRTKQHILGWEEECASDRIRGRFIAEALPTEIELYREDTNYFNVIYHDTDYRIYGSILNILDVCDYALIAEDRFEEFAKKMDCIVCANQGLYDAIKINVPKVIIGDGHNLTKRIKKWHKEKVDKAVWFGYIDNFHCVEPYLDTLKENGIKLRVIAEHDNKKGDEFIKWELETVDKYINECDFALLPFNNKYKTNNKDITAWLCGLPVAKTKEDIIAFKDKKNRLEYLKNVDFYKYNIINRARDYFNLCAEYWDIKRKGITKKSS